MMIDTHAHLFVTDFDNDRAAMMKRMQENGVKQVFLPNIDASTIPALLKMEKDFPDQTHAMMGLHPESVKENVNQELAVVEGWLKKRPFAAVGEIGLDFYWDVTYKEQQIYAFSTQIDWALKYHLPIVIHARNSMKKCLEIVKEKQNGSLKGIFHCYSGNLQQVKEVIDLGFLMGIGGIITFKKAQELREIVQKTDLKHLVLETDSPYLTPSPYRGKRNESSYIPFIAQKIAEVKECTVEEVAKKTTQNALTLYNI